MPESPRRVLVPLAPGFEEIEAITVIDILRRAGLEVITAGTVDGPIEASRRTRHLPDCTLDQLGSAEFDLIVLPGGLPGATHLRKNQRLKVLLEKFKQQNKPVAAICAAPIVLAAHGHLQGRTVTGHPTVRAELAGAAAQVSAERVVVDGPIITSQAAGSAMEFAFRLVELLCGPAKVAEVNQGVLARL